MIDMSPSDLRVLQSAPLWVFTAVAGADGKVDKRETAALSAILSEAESFRHETVKTIFAGAAEQLEALRAEQAADERLLGQAFAEIREVVDRNMASADAREFKLALLAVASRIAEASRGGFLGLHGRVSQDEKAAVIFIAARLGLKPQDFEP